MTSKKLGLLAVVLAAAVIWALPTASVGKPSALQKAESALRDATTQLGDAVDDTVTKTGEAVRKTRDKAGAALDTKSTDADKRATTSEPATQPPLHGTGAHGEGTVAVVDLSPLATRPYSGDPTGKTDGEEIVVGRSRGEQTSSGAYHGHITVVGLFGNEVVGTDTNAGESKHGPLDAVQTGLLNPLCNGTSNQVCASVLTSDSTTTSNGSTNHFSVAHATLGGAGGISTGAAESNGSISTDGTCQTTHGDSQAANVAIAGSALASVTQSSTDAKACNGQTPTHSGSSSVIGLGGTGVPLPAPGCADGTADTITGIPTVLPLVCNGDDSSGQASDPYAVREALDAFVLATGTTSAAKVTAAGADRVRSPRPATPRAARPSARTARTTTATG